MKKWRMTILSLVGMGLLLMGCGSEEAQPVAIQEGVDKCDVCHMHIPDDHNATQILMSDGRAKKFDDLGCLNKWAHENGTEHEHTQYVRDYNTNEWVKADQAAFVFDLSFSTPMGYGIYSFKDTATAEKFVQDQGKGKLMTYADLANHNWERNMSKEEGQQHGSQEGSSTHGNTDSQTKQH
jgi:copper chaperone NosL